MRIERIGTLTPDPDVAEWLVSEPFPIPLLRGQSCQFVLNGLEDSSYADELDAALANILGPNDIALARATPLVLQYCQEMLTLYQATDRPAVSIQHPGDVWRHVEFGSALHIDRRHRGDEEDGIYFTLECACDWEVEHGLQLVIRDGLAITKIGPFDGHLTNSDAFGDPTLKGVVYRSFL